MNKKIYITLIIFSLIGTIKTSTVYAEDLDTGVPQESQEQVENIGAEEKTPQLQGRAIMLDVNSDKLEYIEEKSQFVATGSAEIRIPEQNSKLEAQKIIYDQVKQMIIAEGGIKIIKDGKIISGDYAKIDLTKESALISNPNTVIQQIKITANTANIYPKSIEALKGKAWVNNQDLKFNLSTTGGFANDKPTDSVVNDEKFDADGKPSYKIVAKEVIINSEQHRNVVIIKNASILVGKVKVASIPYLELSTDKRNTRIETMLPEIGYDREIGTYLGPSHVFYLPKGATLKASPIITFGTSDEIVGAGGMARFTTETNRTTIAYSTLKDKVVFEGEQQLFSPNLKAVYASNSYVRDGFLGNRKAKYLFEAVDSRKLASAFNFDFFTRTSAGYAEDYNSDFGTARFKLQGNLVNNKPLYSIRDDLLQFGVQSQFDFTVYGTGNTFGLLRLGPRINSRLGPVSLHTAYYQAAVHGHTPFLFDRYMYGKSNWVIGGDVRVTDNLSIGHIRSLNLLKDNWEKRFSTENLIYARVGPDDLKLQIGYDFVRKRSTFGVDLLLGPGRTALDFDKLRVNEVK